MKGRIAALKRDSFFNAPDSPWRLRPSSPGASSEIPESITVDSTVVLSDDDEVELQDKEEFITLPPLINTHGNAEGFANATGALGFAPNSPSFHFPPLAEGYLDPALRTGNSCQSISPNPYQQQPIVNTPLNSSYSNIIMNSGNSSPTDTSDTYDFEELRGRYKVLDKIGEGTFSCVFKAYRLSNPSEIVALKRIYSTCSPCRILNELRHLKTVGGQRGIVSLYEGIRLRDQITLVLPYFEHDKFKDYLPTMTLEQIQLYMKTLFNALELLQRYNIIHRDIKPGNFLYNIQKGELMLVDFGLAQLQENDTFANSNSIHIDNSATSITPTQFKLKRHGDPALLNARESKRGRFTNTENGTSINLENSVASLVKKPIQAPRAGTRGFRAPEVLLKYPKQTVAIDIWSAGVILLCILSTRYPFFNSPDDLTSLAEIGSLCGTKEVREQAIRLGRNVKFPREFPKIDLKQLCTMLSSHRTYVVPDSAFHLLERCLDLNPFTRISAAEALQHPFFQE